VTAQPRLILMCGMPGSGKTTRALSLAAAVPAVRLCPDEWMASLDVNLFDEGFRDRVEQHMWTLARELLQTGLSVILESGHWLRSDRDEKRLWARSSGILVEVQFLDVPLEETWRRMKLRNATSAHGTVPLEKARLEEYVRHFQAPDADELALFDAPS
jgi:predicted kinase